MRLVILAATAAFAAGAAHAQSPNVEISAVVTGFVTAVNKGEMDKALGFYAANVAIVDDLPPYRWTGAGAGGAWLQAMGANAGATGVTGIEMKVSPLSRVEVDKDRAYAIAPGLLTFTYKDGHKEQAKGQLAFTLGRTAGAWKIDGQTWTAPAPTR